jgi:hypothetical protein
MFGGAASAGDVTGAPVIPGCGRSPGLPLPLCFSNGAGEVAEAPVATGLVPAVGGVPAGLPFPRPLSNGVVGAAAAGEVMPVAGTVGEIPPGTCPVAAAPVGGGMFFGFSV